jgi:hypothetical protein
LIPCPSVVNPDLEVIVPVTVNWPVTYAVKDSDGFKKEGLADEVSEVVVVAFLTTPSRS